MKCLTISSLFAFWAAAGAVTAGLSQDDSAERRWLDDESGVFEYAEIDGVDVARSWAVNKGSSRYNTLYLGSDESAAMTRGKYFWKLVARFGDESAAQEGISVGISHKDALAKSFRVRGMFFEGVNLSNGGALLAPNYGTLRSSRDREDSLTETVLMLVDINDLRVQISFVQNGRPLGLAFDVPMSCDNDKPGVPTPLFPAVGFHGGRASVSIESVDSVDESMYDREVNAYATARDPILGFWKASAVKKGVDVPDDLTLSISRGRSEARGKTSYSLTTKVINTLSLQLECEGLFTIEMNGKAVLCKPGVVMSTLMVGNETEDEVKAFLESIKQLQSFRPIHPISGEYGDELLRVNHDQVLMSRFAVPFNPVVTNPFDRVITG